MIMTDLDDGDEFLTIWMAQDTESNVWFLKIYIFFDDETILLGTPVENPLGHMDLKEFGTATVTRAVVIPLMD